VRHSANRSLCRLPDEIHSAKHVTLGKERVSGSVVLVLLRISPVLYGHICYNAPFLNDIYIYSGPG
jgi:hypothetical protein